MELVFGMKNNEATSLIENSSNWRKCVKSLSEGQTLSVSFLWFLIMDIEFRDIVVKLSGGLVGRRMVRN